VLASDIGGLPELFANGEAGHLFSSGNVDALAESAQGLWTNPEQLRKMGLRARNIVETRFSQSQRLTALIAVYNDVIGQKVLKEP